jgi:hypothetical protein
MKTENEQIDEALEGFANEKAEIGLPSNFTYLMMQKIEKEAARKVTAKKALITPLAWVIFGGFTALITASLIFGNFSTAVSISLPEIDLTKHADKIKLAAGTVFAIGTLVLLDTVYRRRAKRQKPS